jgi:hypothetical protein
MRMQAIWNGAVLATATRQSWWRAITTSTVALRRRTPHRPVVARPTLGDVVARTWEDSENLP